MEKSEKIMPIFLIIILILLLIEFGYTIFNYLDYEKRKDSEQFNSIEEAKRQILYRFNEENNRWFKTYGVHRDDMSNYDLVIDTTDLTIEEVNTIVLNAYKKWLNE